MSKVLSFDVSVKSTGWAFVDDSGKLDFGIIPSSGMCLKCLMPVLEGATRELCYKYSPDTVVIENTHFGAAGLDTLKKLEMCRSSVKRTCFYSLSIWPEEIWPQTVRSHFGVKGKKGAFDFVKSAHDIDFLVYEKHNDITDAILMSLYALETKIKCSGACGSHEEREALLGVIFGKRCVEKEGSYYITWDDEEIILTKYFALGSVVDGSIIYNNTGQCSFSFSGIHFYKEWFSLNSLFYIFLDSLIFKNNAYYFEVNKEHKDVFDVILSSAPWAAGIKKLKTRYKIPKEVFEKNILSELKNSFRRSDINLLMNKVKK